MRLVACPDCRRQFDVTHVEAPEIRCACGATVANEVHAPFHTRVHRCGSCGAGVVPDATGCDYCGAAIVRDESRLSLICPECYARNAGESRFCTACGVAFDPQPVVPAGAELPCADCGGLMPPRGVGGVPVNECPACNGLWVPDGQFEVLIARAVDAARKAEAGTLTGRAPRRAGGNPASQQVRYRKCPVCAAFMQRRNYRRCSGVILDACRDHGTWLDADELEQIAGFILESGGVPPEPPPPAAAGDSGREHRHASPHAAAAHGVGDTVLALIATLLD